MVTVLDIIKEKIKEIKNPKKIFLSFKSWNKMVKEENLVGNFCTECKRFIETDHCSKCKERENVIVKELPVFTILDLPYEVSSAVEEVKIL